MSVRGWKTEGEEGREKGKVNEGKRNDEKEETRSVSEIGKAGVDLE